VIAAALTSGQAAALPVPHDVLGYSEFGGELAAALWDPGRTYPVLP
jgi:hypothetical protein